jgi:polyisoprenoid-binding protein YceI
VGEGRESVRQVILFLICALVAMPAEAKVWKIDYSTSKLSFTGTQTGKPFTGSFGAYVAEVKFDPDNLMKSRIEVTIDMSSARTGDKQRDTALPGKDWFDTAVFQQATFLSTSVTRTTGPRQYVAKGKLTIKTITQDVELPFSLLPDRDGMRAKGELVVDRTKFNVGLGEWLSEEWVGHKVTIGVDLMGY